MRPNLKIIETVRRLNDGENLSEKDKKIIRSCNFIDIVKNAASHLLLEPLKFDCMYRSADFVYNELQNRWWGFCPFHTKLVPEDKELKEINKNWIKIFKLAKEKDWEGFVYWIEKMSLVFTIDNDHFLCDHCMICGNKLEFVKAIFCTDTKTAIKYIKMISLIGENYASSLEKATNSHGYSRTRA